MSDNPTRIGSLQLNECSIELLNIGFEFEWAFVLEKIVMFS